MLSEIKLEIGNQEFTFTIEDFEHGHPGSYFDPPDPAEIILGEIVYVGADDNEITFGLACLEYAIANSCTVDEANDRIHEKCLDKALDWYAAQDY